jgi:hypothetical protein
MNCLDCRRHIMWPHAIENRLLFQVLCWPESGTFLTATVVVVGTSATVEASLIPEWCPMKKGPLRTPSST